MLRIRLTRVGKANQPSYRIVVAEHARPVKGKYIESMGFYNPIVKPKVFTVEQARIEYWISKGAQPSSTVASLLKINGMKNMDQWIEKRVSDMKNKKAAGKEAAAPAPVPAAAPKAPEATPAA